MPIEEKEGDDDDDLFIDANDIHDRQDGQGFRREREQSARRAMDTVHRRMDLSRRCFVASTGGVT